MQYQISGKQIDIGEALQIHVKEDLGGIVQKYAERPTDAQVIFSKNAHEYVCETIVHLSTGLTAQAKVTRPKSMRHSTNVPRKWKSNCVVISAG